MSATTSSPGKVTFKVSPDKLRAILHTKKEASPSPDIRTNVESAPAPAGVADTSMGPPAKKGVKRSAPGTTGEPRDRKKPGPKKKKLDDGETKPERGHKLGPKANQGAINAGLRALDRSGKPCRRWVRTSFMIKSFTGVTWEIPRWSTPVQLDADGTVPGQPVTTVEKTKDDSKPEKVDGRKRKPNGEKAASKKSNGTGPDAKAEPQSTEKEKPDSLDIEMQDAPPVTDISSAATPIAAN